MKKKLLFIFALCFFIYTSNAQCNIANTDLGSPLAGGTAQWGQSFQPNCNGILDKVKVLARTSATGITVTIYDGNGLSGTVLGSLTSQSITEVSDYTDYSVFDFSSENIILTSGNSYTFDISGGGSFYFDANASPNYSGGNIYNNGTSYTLYDLLFEIEIVAAPQTKAYVDINASGNNDGTSWTNAYTNLQEAIDNVEADGEIWIADGTYVPTASPDGVSTDTRDYAFHMDKNLKIYGGFAGTEANLSDRTDGNTTILSGDLDNDGDISDNAYHVLITYGLSASTTIDELTITKANSNGSGDLVFAGQNYARIVGAGMHNNASSPNITNVIFENNTSSHVCGGLYNSNSSSPIVSNVNIVNNTANYGAGMYNAGSSPTLTNVFIANNTSGAQGGAMENFAASSPNLTNVVIANNSAGTNGGGMFNSVYSYPTFNNVTFYNNSTNGAGGAMYNNNNTSPVINNCVFYNNTASNNINDVHNTDATSSPTGNNNASDHTNAPGITVTLTANPFTLSNNINGLDNIYANADDGLRPSYNSPLINAGNNNYNSSTNDISGRARIYNTTIDIGAYENRYLAWTGAVNGDWNNTANWNGNVAPTSTDEVFIPFGVPNYPNETLNTFVANSIEVASGAAILTNSGGHNLIMRRAISDINWHLVGTSVVGESFEDVIQNHSFATGSVNTNNIGIAAFITPYNSWNYATSSTKDTMYAPRGYAVKLSESSELAFQGTSFNSSSNTPIIAGTNSYNLLANPFPAYVDYDELLSGNHDLTEQTLWIWEGNQYVAYNAANTILVAPNQGYFVEAASSYTFNIGLSDVTLKAPASGDTFKKEEEKSQFELFLESDGNKKGTKVFYIENTTTGFDNGYDSKMFGGTTYDFAVFTELVTDNEGKQLAIQSLPKESIESYTIPVGLIANAGEEVTFSINQSNLEDLSIYLEDINTGVITNLSETAYKVTLTESHNGTGNFYITVSGKSLSSATNLALNNISIYKSSDTQLTITGIQGKINTTIYSLSGNQVHEYTLTSNGSSTIDLPNLSAGVYIVKLSSDSGSKTQKIILN